MKFFSQSLWPFLLFLALLLVLQLVEGYTWQQGGASRQITPTASRPQISTPAEEQQAEETLFQKQPLEPVTLDEKDYSQWLALATQRLMGAKERLDLARHHPPSTGEPGSNLFGAWPTVTDWPAVANVERALANCNVTGHGSCTVNTPGAPHLGATSFDLGGRVYSIQDRAAFWSLSPVGRSTSREDSVGLGIVSGSYDNCAGAGSKNECGFRLVSIGFNLYHIETADGEGILAVQGKNDTGQVREDNPLVVFRKSSYRIRYSIDSETTFKILPNGNGLWRILCGDESGTLQFYEYDQHLASYLGGGSFTGELVVYMQPIQYENCAGYNCQWRLTRIY